MKPVRHLASVAALAIALPLVAQAAVPVPVTLGANSTLTVHGTSTLHAWEATTHQTSVAVMRADDATVTDLRGLAKAGQVTSVDIKVPVTTLKSDKEGLDKNMYKALKAEPFPDITVRLGRFTLPATGSAGDTLAVQAEGTLTIAGQSQPAILPGKLYPGGGGLWLDGQYTLKMSTFGIKPPTMMMGTIKVGDAVTIRYHLQFTNREAAGGSSAASGL